MLLACLTETVQITQDLFIDTKCPLVRCFVKRALLCQTYHSGVNKRLAVLILIYFRYLNGFKALIADSFILFRYKRTEVIFSVAVEKACGFGSILGGRRCDKCMTS